ncbi:MAG: ferredoxin [Kiritimatiellia bacterium]
MQVKVTEDCIACGLCVELCPDVFQIGDQYAEVQLDPVPQEFANDVEHTADECPVSAIVIDEDLIGEENGN